MNRPWLLYIALALSVILLQGFQCASSNVTSAKRSMQKQEWQGAKESLVKAVAENPNDCEALMLLGDVANNIGDDSLMLASYQAAQRCEGTDGKLRSEISVRMFNAWVVAYNAGITAYNTYATHPGDKAPLKIAADRLYSAIKLKPASTEPMALLGIVLEADGDTIQAYKAYDNWWQVEKPGFDVIRDKKLTLGSTRQQVLDILGKPSETRTDSLAQSGVLYKDKFDVGGRFLYMFSANGSANTPPVLEGWTYNPPSELSEGELWRSKVTTMAPLKAMAFINYGLGKKAQALELCNALLGVKPTDQELVPLRTQLLQDLGQTDVVVKELEQLIRTNPEQLTYRIQYASLLTGLNRSSEANEQYQIVLTKEPQNGTALYGLAANYKNIAGSKQRLELDKMDKDRKYQPNQDYLKDLEKSAGYFEQLRKLPQYKTDIVVLEQLANVYEVTKEKSKLRELISEMEALEAQNADNKTYYQIMEGIYGRNNMIEKMKAAAAKGAKL